MALKQPDSQPLNDKMLSVTSHVILITLTNQELDNLNISTKSLENGGQTVPTDLNLKDEDRNFIWPATPSVFKGQVALYHCHILVFHEFPMMVETISSILAYRGVKMHIINGTHSCEQCDQVIDDFINSKDPEKWILLSPSVGSVGLNLTCVDVVIMLVGVEQIIGQSTWLTQDKPVHIYYLIALQTTDVLMFTLAQEKGEMLETLLTKGTNLKLQKILDNEEDEDDIDLGVEEDRPKKVSGSRMPKKKLMAATTKASMKQAPSRPVTDKEESTKEKHVKGNRKATAKQAAQPPAVEDPVKRKRKAKAKSREFVELSTVEESMKEESVKGLGRVKRKGKAKVSMKQVSKKPEAKVKKRMQHCAAARDAKKDMSDGAYQSKEELVPQPVKRSTSSSSDEDFGKQTVTAQASQWPTEDNNLAMDIDDQSQAVPPSSKGNDNNQDLEQPAEDINSSMVGDSPAMDVDVHLSLTLQPCGQPMRITLPTPTGMQTPCRWV
ncbi:hypothetical protein BDN71DRAFT_1432613 [Pleurotus eryngii]|uniref:Helicase C-terminal domain-containing protein n=1 Tax=Pleurotus eryngii TaxID=5323 RepID=A0A9P5ZWX0_PLEER|nr:hypothetical protein BDN71DRAFT_1432613 [Pleurotus eryngii]